MSEETTELDEALDLTPSLKLKLEVRVFNEFSNLMEVVFTVYGAGDDDVTMDHAINLLHKIYEKKDTTTFFGQVWEVNPNNRLHYEI